jgi:regulator of replication initiation timing
VARLPTQELMQALLTGRGSVAAGVLLRFLLLEPELRELCARFDLKPKGGFRIEKAPLHLLLPVLEKALLERDEVRDAVAAAVTAQAAAPAAEKTAPADPQRDRLVELKDQEIRRLKDEADQAREVAGRRGEHVEALQRRIDELMDEAAQIRAEREFLRRELDRLGKSPREPQDSDRDIVGFLRRVEQLETLNEELRRSLAVEATNIATLQAETDELRSKVPDWRKKTPQPPPADLPQQDAGVFPIPVFTPDFYRSLVDRDRRVVQAAFQAVFLLVSRGPSYPGLETKRLEGTSSLWSIRATIKHRVYFEFGQGEFKVLRLEDRREQDRFLRHK